MRASAAIATLAAVLLTAPAAAADDQSVWDAYAHAHRAELRQAVNAYGRAADRLDFRRARRVRATIRAGRRVSRTLATIARGVRAEAPSSATGEEAKALLLDSLSAWRRAMTLDARSLRAYQRGRLARGSAAGERSDAALARSGRLEARAVSALRAAGVTLGG